MDEENNSNKPPPIFDSNETLMDIHFKGYQKNDRNTEDNDSTASDKSRIELLDQCVESFGRLCTLNSKWIKLSIERDRRVYALRDTFHQTERAADKCEMELKEMKNDLEAFSAKIITTTSPPDYIRHRMDQIESCIGNTYDLIAKQRDVLRKHSEIVMPEIAPLRTRGNKQSKAFLFERLEIHRNETEHLENLINELQDQLEECNGLENGCKWLNKELLKHKKWLQRVELEIEVINDPNQDFVYRDSDSEVSVESKETEESDSDASAVSKESESYESKVETLRHSTLFTYKSSHLMDDESPQYSIVAESSCACSTKEEMENCLETEHDFSDEKFNQLFTIMMFLSLIVYFSN
jgi:hypothetical protein